MTRTGTPAGISVGVLVIEDDWFIVSQIAEALIGSRYRMIEAVPAVDAALHALSRNRPCAVILDGTLRGQSTTPIARQMQTTSIPFIVLTGSPPTYYDAVGQSIPALLKPFARQDLIAALNRLPIEATR